METGKQKQSKVHRKYIEARKKAEKGLYLATYEANKKRCKDLSQTK